MKGIRENIIHAKTNTNILGFKLLNLSDIYTLEFIKKNVPKLYSDIKNQKEFNTPIFKGT